RTENGFQFAFGHGDARRENGWRDSTVERLLDARRRPRVEEKNKALCSNHEQRVCSREGARLTDSTACAVELVGDGERLLQPCRRQILVHDLFGPFENLELVALLVRRPERDHGFERRTAGKRAGDFGNENRRFLRKTE